MEQFELELEIGETVLLGNYSLTLLDFDFDHIDVRIDSEDESGIDNFLPNEFAAD